jgi:nitrite reductase/ring-hydroxylating ferredoxin subunit
MANPECGGCPLNEVTHACGPIERRDFLRAIGLALGTLALGARELTAMTSPAEPRRYPIPPSDGAVIDKEGSVIVARVGDKVFAFSLACPHQNTALRWDGTDREFKCPKHKSHYRADGTFIDGRATRDMDRLAVRREGAVLVVELDSMFRHDEQPVEWSNAFVLATP